MWCMTTAHLHFSFTQSRPQTHSRLGLSIQVNTIKTIPTDGPGQLSLDGPSLALFSWVTLDLCQDEN